MPSLFDTALYDTGLYDDAPLDANSVYIRLPETQMSYVLWLLDVNGNRIAVLDTYVKLEYVLTANEPGVLTLTLPASFPLALIQPDSRIEVWRQPPGGARHLAGDATWFVTQISYVYDKTSGVETIVLIARSGLILLDRRIVAYSAGSAQAAKSGPLDTMLKAIVRENLGSLATDTARSWAALLTVEADTNAAPSDTHEFARMNVLKTCQDIAAASLQLGTALYFDIVSPASGAFEFRTFVGQRGIAHGAGSAQPVLFGPALGNVAGATWTRDYDAEATAVYAVGQGALDEVSVQYGEDTVRSQRSPFGRKEVFRHGKSAASGAALLDEAQAGLIEGRPKLKAQVEVIDAPGTVMGVHWRWGDVVSGTFGGVTADFRANVVHGTVEQGKETIDVRLDATVVL